MKLDLIITNADIVTMDPQRPSATTVGIVDGLIAGIDSDVADMDATEVVDLRGATVTPGFNDAHCHTTWFGLGLIAVDLSATRGLDQVYEVLAAASVDESDTGWLMAIGFNHIDHGGAFPDIEILDKLTGDRPLYIRHASGHSSIANSTALRLAGVLAHGFSEPAGGTVVRNADGSPTGLLEETAQNLVQDLLRPYAQKDIVAAIDRATNQYAREGITSFTEAGVGGGWIGHSPLEGAAYSAALAADKLHARAQLMPTIDTLHPLSGHPEDGVGIGLDLGIRTGFGNDILSLGPAKVFTDGTMVNETAAMIEPYCSHDHGHHASGYFLKDPDELREDMLHAYQSGWSLAAHAIGDRAVKFAVDVLTECQEKFGRNPVPNRIEHCSVTPEDQLSRIAAAGIVVTPQASLFHSLGDAWKSLVGADREPNLYRAKSFVEAGVILAGSSDRPVGDGNPLHGMQSFVDRRSSSGATVGSPSECLTPRDALAAYTSLAAIGTGQWHRKGSVTRGKLADLTVLSESPIRVSPSRIAGIEVMATILGGRFTHCSLT